LSEIYCQQGAREPGDIISYRRAPSSRNQRATSSESAASVKQIARQPLLPAVIREIDIWRVAVLMVNRYGDEAKLDSLRRAAELTVDGDHAGTAIWRRVAIAIEQLTDTTGLLN